ncbi:unnamed protein product [Cylindrotheca closterium]|uniref:GOLD domain-containing protein n=1 Tax=Cylindrotheca closterium TaxID=2856 RepID=A0AAD2CPG1_9STRA|nr:unnamed protein product [Cylindrotheca closterium]
MTTSNPSFVARRYLMLWTSIIAGCLLIQQCEASYVVKVEPYDEQCFYIAPSTHSTIYGDFEMLEDGLSPKPISVLVTDAQDSRTLYRSRTNVRKGSFKVEANPREKIYICVQNGLVAAGNKNIQRKGKTKSDGLPRLVGLDISVEERDLHDEIHQTHSKILSKAVMLSKELTKLKNHHEYMRAREAKHRETVEHTFSKLLGWALAQASGVILIAVGQILYLKRFLERRRYM